MKTKPSKASKSRSPHYVWSRAGLEVRLATIFGSDDLAVVVRDFAEQTMVYRAKPDEALRFARRLAGLIGRALDRTVDAMLRPPLHESRPSREK